MSDSEEIPPKKDKGPGKGTKGTKEKDASETVEATPGGSQEVRSASTNSLSPEMIKNMKELMDECLQKHMNTYSGIFQKLVDETCDSFKEEIKAEWTGFQDIENHRRLVNETELIDLKRKVSKLPKDGDLSALFTEKAINESVNLTQQSILGDDSINCTFFDRQSVLQTLNKTEWVTKDRLKAPSSLAYSIVGFMGPAGNDNWMNVRETTLTEYEKTLLDRFPLIPDRVKSLEPLRKGASNVTRTTRSTGATASTAEDDFARECFLRGQKWDSDFARDAPKWDGKSDFDNFFSNLWRMAKMYRISDPMLFKDLCYQCIYEAKGEKLGDLITPEKNPALSALSYYLMIRKLVTPFSDPEVATQFFYNLKQESNQPVDTFFQKKLKVFKLMNPGVITKKQWRDFYLNVSKSLLYSNLAVDMANYIDTMQFLDDYNAFLHKLVSQGQRYLNWDGSGHISRENLSSCHSQAMEMFQPTKPAEMKKHPVINIVSNDNTPTDINAITSKEENGELPDFGEVPSWVDNDEEPLEWDDQLEGVVGVLNARSKTVKCWHCNIPGHVVNQCNKRKEGQPPHPDSKFGKTRKRFSPFKKPYNSNNPNSSKIPEQFARNKTIGQLDPGENNQAEIDKQVQAIMKQHVHY